MRLDKKQPNRQMTFGGLVILVTLFISLSASGTISASTSMIQDHPVGGTLVAEQTNDITQLCQPVEPGGGWWTSYSLYDRLVEVDVDTVEPIPGLAESWEISSDGLTYTFHLYENAWWHDDVKFTAEDVKYTYDYMIDNDMPGKQYLGAIESVEMADDYTIILHLSRPNAAQLAYLGTWTGYTAILPKHIFDIGIPWEDNPNIYEPIGTGPFKFVELRPGEYVKLARHDKYHKGAPYLDYLVWQIVPDVAVAIQMLKTGELHVLGAGNSPAFSELDALSKIDGLEARMSPLGGEDVFSLEFNSGNPDLPYNDVNVRKAIALAINRQELQDKVFFGYTKVAESMFTIDIPWAYNPDAKVPGYDPDEANRLLDEAGYPRGDDGIRFETHIKYGTFFGAQLTGLAEVISEQLKVVGIEVGYTMYEWLLWLEQVKRSHDFELSLYLEYASPDPDEVGRIVVTDARSNGGEYSNSRVDELFELGLTTTDRSIRAEYYYEVQDIMAEELPYYPLVDQDYWFVVAEDYHGFWFEEGVDATRQNPWRTWWEGGIIETTSVALFPTQFIAILGAIVPGILVTALAIHRRRR